MVILCNKVCSSENVNSFFFLSMLLESVSFLKNEPQAHHIFLLRNRFRFITLPKGANALSGFFLWIASKHKRSCAR